MSLKYKILSIDGGGIRGVIPARILQEIETRSGQKVSELFDFAVGTSTGSILVIASSIYENERPKFSALDMLNLYVNHGKKIFTKDSFGVLSAKYDRAHLDKILEEYFGDVMLSEAAYPIAAVSYSLDTGTPTIWSSLEARINPENDAHIKHVAGASSAAPTYFAPIEFYDDAGYVHHEVDGGIFLNNPQVIGMMHILKYDPTVKPEDVVMVSIGTGSTELANKDNELSSAGVIGWLKGGRIIDTIMDASSNFADMEAAIIYPNRYRLQVDIPNELNAMDNASAKNIEALLHVTEDFIKANSSVIDKIIEELTIDFTHANDNEALVENHHSEAVAV